MGKGGWKKLYSNQCFGKGGWEKLTQTNVDTQFAHIYLRECKLWSGILHLVYIGVPNSVR